MIHDDECHYVCHYECHYGCHYVCKDILRKKIISWACFKASGLNNLFHWYADCDILNTSSLRNSDKELESRTTEKIEVSSAESLAFEINPSGKSLI